MTNKMIKKIGWCSLCFLLLFHVSCNKEDEADTSLPTATIQTTELQLSFGGASTYAQLEANEEEKKLESIAIFVQVGTGNTFSSHLLTQDQLIGSTATIEVKSNDLSTTAQIVVIANYKENGILESQLSAAHTLTDLQNLRTPAIAENGTMPGYPLKDHPLLMYYTQSFDNLQTYLQTNNKIDVKLQRMAARVDVIDSTHTDKFKLISAQLLNPKSQTYLLPDNTSANIGAIDRLESFFQVTTVTPTDKRISLYTYETAETESNLLTVQVVYEFNAKGYIQDFPFKDKDGKAILIERNKLYTVNFSLNGNELSFIKIVVDDFEEGGEGEIEI